MCGIIGVVSDDVIGAREILVSGLERLEYRGYDSAGVALIAEATAVYKAAGRVAALRKVIPVGADAGTGVAHTRWATHGPPSEKNAHPHKDCRGRVVLVHNGIIENFGKLRGKLQDEGHRFGSDTDTEAVAHLFEQELSDVAELSVEAAEAAFRRTIRQLEGAYAIVATVAGMPGVLFGARLAAPLLAGVAKGRSFLASDVTAVIEHTKQVVYLEDGDIAIATPAGLRITDHDGNEIHRDSVHIDWGLEEAQKGGFEHFMLKEIYDGPRAVSEALTGRIRSTPPHIGLDWGLPEGALKGVKRLLFLACGTSFHAGLVGKHFIEKLVGLPVDVVNSSEYRYGPQVREERTLAIAISQSGETADTLAAMREARRRGHKTLAISNVVGSTITREADGTLYIRAGPEIGVAATKSFLGQLCAIYLVGLAIAETAKVLSASEVRRIGRELQHVPRLVQQVLDRSPDIRAVAEHFAGASSAFYLGRQILYPVALEGALKMKEISYIHAEGYSGGELKHGPFALLTRETPVVALLAPDHVYEKMISNVIEVKARGPSVFLFTTDSDKEAPKYGDHIVRVPDCDPLLLPIVHSAALHLFSYWAAAARGCEIDKPRNLAKSVTVE